MSAGLLPQRLDSLALFRPLLCHPVLRRLRAYWAAPSTDRYGAFAAALYESGFSSLGELLDALCSSSENPYVKAVGAGKDVPSFLRQALLEELDTLQAVADLTPEKLREPLSWQGYLPEFGTQPVDVKGAYLRRVGNISKWGYGIFAANHMFCLDGEGRVAPVLNPDGISFSDLAEYEPQRRAVLDNTRALLAGKPAANALLTGDAGTGKSSTIKAVANALWPEGLRLIEVRKEQLRQIPALLGELASNPLKFILFIDDLSFSENDDDFSALKAVLEGSVWARPCNVVVYATSNRRHIVRERFSDREGDDVHRNDSIQEVVSLSERFGLQITFQKPDKAAYLHIVKKLARQRGVALPEGELERRAEQAALHRGGRSARLAQQLVDELVLLDGKQGSDT